MIAHLEEEKMSMADAHSEGLSLIQEGIIVEIVEALIDKVAQMMEKGKELVDKFYNLDKEIHRACTT